MANADQIAALTEKQRECLRRVLTHHSSKEIARELGIGVDAVDQRIKASMRKLGVNSRTEAAKLLAQSEGFGSEIPAGRVTSSARKKLAYPLSVVARFRPRTKRGRFTLWSCLAAFIFSMSGMGEVIDYWLRHQRLGPATTKASGEIALITVDKKAVDRFGPVPFPRRHFARLVNELDRMGVRRVLPLFYFDTPSEAADDQALADAFHRLRTRLLLPVAFVKTHDGGETRSLPLPEFSKFARLVHIDYFYTYAREFDRFDGSIAIGRDTVPSGSSALASEIPVSSSFIIDHRIDAATIPTLRAIDVIDGNLRREVLEGKDVVIAVHGEIARDYVFPVPGRGRLSTGQLTVLAAETYRRGVPFETTWFTEFLLGSIVVGLACIARNKLRSTIVLVLGAAIIAYAPYLVEPWVYIGIANPLLFILLVATGTTWISFRSWHHLRRQLPA